MTDCPVCFGSGLLAEGVVNDVCPLCERDEVNMVCQPCSIEDLWWEPRFQAVRDPAFNTDERDWFNGQAWRGPLQCVLDASNLSHGDANSMTGLNVNFEPMLAHDSSAIYNQDASGGLVQKRIFERPARLSAIYLQLVEQDLISRCRLLSSRLVSRADVERVHPAEHVDLLLKQYATDEEARQALKLDSGYFCSAKAPETAGEFGVVSKSTHAALMAAGTVVDLCTRVWNGELGNAMALVRPPGHHCGRMDKPHNEVPGKGYGLLSNVAIAVNTIRQQQSARPLRRVMILDWDVHHGDGTQSIFDSDPDVLFVSLHRYDGSFYPRTGAPEDIGSAKGRGTCINIGWSHPKLKVNNDEWDAKYAGDVEYMRAFKDLVMPIAIAFDPELVVISAGFDSAEGDPDGEMRITPNGYAHMTQQLLTLAGGKLCAVLEGGYNLRSIAASAAGVVRVLLGDAPEALADEAVGGTALEDLRRAARAVAPCWSRVPEVAGLADRLSVELEAENFSSIWSLAVRKADDLKVLVRKSPEGILYLDRLAASTDEVFARLEASDQIEAVDCRFGEAVPDGWEQLTEITIQHYVSHHDVDLEGNRTKSVADWLRFTIHDQKDGALDFQKCSGVDACVAFMQQCLHPEAAEFQPFRLRLQDRTGMSLFLSQ